MKIARFMKTFAGLGLLFCQSRHYHKLKKRKNLVHIHELVWRFPFKNDSQAE